MVFSSLTFLFMFLPILIVVYYISNDKNKNYILLIASLIFYSWGEPKYIIIMLVSIIFNYFIAILIGKNKKKNIRKLFLVLAVIFNIGMLFSFKYINFFIDNINAIFNTSINGVNVSLPIGISFYTFQILSYVIDVYKKEVKVQKNILYLGTYISFFPQLIAGPIVRYSTIEEQLNKRTHSFEKICSGVRRFIVGFGKKVIIANNAALIADSIFDSKIFNSYGVVIILLGLLAYTIQIYYDFSGYSDMAIGLGNIFGFDFLENFNYPYSAISITDFWRRWHMSLSSWFRDYLYIPLGGNRVSKVKWIRNILIVWLLTGLWHGASFNFVLWGLFYAVFLLFEKLVFSKVLDKLPKIIRWIYAFIIINIGWLIFRIENLSELGIAFKNIFTLKQSNFTSYFLDNLYIIPSIIFIIIGIIFMFPILNVFKKYKDKTIYGIVRDIILLFILVFGIVSLINNSYNPFIYFRF